MIPITRSRLRSLLEPRSIAIVGASEKEGSVGRTTLAQTLAAGFRGPVYPVNPNHRTLQDLTCHPTLEDLPERPDLVVFAVGNAAIEEQVHRAIAMGCEAGVAFASCYVENDTAPPLTERLARVSRDAGFALCGANCMGFINPVARATATWYQSGVLAPGGVGLITHSGALFLSLAANDPRSAYSLVVSPGQELVVNAADVMHYMLDSGETRVIALVLETVRDPEGFVKALTRAAAADVPVTAIKIGRTEQSAHSAQSHSGAITGDDDAYEAVFKHHGVLRARTVNELVATATLLSSRKRAWKGGVAAVLDSGGARGLLLDLAADIGVPMAQIGHQTEKILIETLEYGLEPVNPVDAWGTGHDATRRFKTCLQAVVDDPAAGLGVLFTDVTNDDDPMCSALADVAVEVSLSTEKPVLVATHWSEAKYPTNGIALARSGIPLIQGTENALLAIKHAFDHRDFRARPRREASHAVDKAVVAQWRRRLSVGGDLSELEGLNMLRDFGIEVPRFAAVSSADGLDDALSGLSKPVAVKTAVAGIRHKTERGGVKLGLGDAESVRAAYLDLDRRLGADAIVVEMAPAGIELALGLVADQSFGPVIVVAAGGVMIELFKDRQVALAPVDAADARAMLDGLRLRPMLGAFRGRPAVDLDRLAETIVQFSILASSLGDLIKEMDVNPLIVGPHGAIAVDVLVIPAHGSATQVRPCSATPSGEA